MAIFLIFCFTDSPKRLVSTGEKILIMWRLNFNRIHSEYLEMNMVEHTITEGLMTQKRISFSSTLLKGVKV